eukprot:jgi/Chrzof1/1355/Cz10g04080.t1
MTTMEGGERDALMHRVMDHFVNQVRKWKGSKTGGQCKEVCNEHKDEIYESFRQSGLQPWEFHTMLHRASEYGLVEDMKVLWSEVGTTFLELRKRNTVNQQHPNQDHHQQQQQQPQQQGLPSSFNSRTPNGISQPPPPPRSQSDSSMLRPATINTNDKQASRDVDANGADTGSDQEDIKKSSFGMFSHKHADPTAPSSMSVSSASSTSQSDPQAGGTPTSARQLLRQNSLQQQHQQQGQQPDASPKDQHPKDNLAAIAAVAASQSQGANGYITAWRTGPMTPGLTLRHAPPGFNGTAHAVSQNPTAQANGLRNGFNQTAAGNGSMLGLAPGSSMPMLLQHPPQVMASQAAAHGVQQQQQQQQQPVSKPMSLTQPESAGGMAWEPEYQISALELLPSGLLDDVYEHGDAVVPFPPSAAAPAASPNAGQRQQQKQQMARQAQQQQQAGLCYQPAPQMNSRPANGVILAADSLARSTLLPRQLSHPMAAAVSSAAQMHNMQQRVAAATAVGQQLDTGRNESSAAVGNTQPRAGSWVHVNGLVPAAAYVPPPPPRAAHLMTNASQLNVAVGEQASAGTDAGGSLQGALSSDPLSPGQAGSDRAALMSMAADARGAIALSNGVVSGGATTPSLMNQGAPPPPPPRSARSVSSSPTTSPELMAMSHQHQQLHLESLDMMASPPGRRMALNAGTITSPKIAAFTLPPSPASAQAGLNAMMNNHAGAEQQAAAQAAVQAPVTPESLGGYSGHSTKDSKDGSASEEDSPGNDALNPKDNNTGGNANHGRPLTYAQKLQLEAGSANSRREASITNLQQPPPPPRIAPAPKPATNPQQQPPVAYQQPSTPAGAPVPAACQQQGSADGPPAPPQRPGGRAVKMPLPARLISALRQGGNLTHLMKLVVSERPDLQGALNDRIKSWLTQDCDRSTAECLVVYVLGNLRRDWHSNAKSPGAFLMGMLQHRCQLLSSQGLNRKLLEIAKGFPNVAVYIDSDVIQELGEMEPALRSFIITEYVCKQRHDWPEGLKFPSQCLLSCMRSIRYADPVVHKAYMKLQEQRQDLAKAMNGVILYGLCKCDTATGLAAIKRLSELPDEWTSAARVNASAFLYQKVQELCGGHGF